MSADYYSQFIVPAVYSTTATGGDGYAQVSSTSGRLIGFAATNTSGSTVFAQVFDKIGQPASGSVPIALLQVPANTQESYDVGSAHFHPVATGIVIAGSSTSNTYTQAGGTPLILTAYYII